MPNSLSSHIQHVIEEVPMSTISNINKKFKYWLDLPLFKSILASYYLNIQLVVWGKFVCHKNLVLKYSIYKWLVLVGGMKTTNVLLRRGM